MRGSYVGSADQTGNPFQIVDLSEHPEYARRVGEIVSLWAMIELRLSIVFGMLLRAPPWQAWEAFFAINNAKARIDMLRALAVALDDRIPEKSELLDLLKRAQDAPAARHGYAHRPWVEYKGQLYQMDMPAIPIEDSGKHHVPTRTMEPVQNIWNASHNPSQIEAMYLESIRRFSRQYSKIFRFTVRNISV